MHNYNLSSVNYLSLEDDSFRKVIEWLVNEEHLTLDQANQCKKEFLMFASIGLDPQNPLFKSLVIVPSANADKFLHTFLLFNYDYNKWCKKNYGDILYHHPKENSKDGWILTQNAIKNTFGEIWNYPATSGMGGEACIDTDLEKW